MTTVAIAVLALFTISVTGLALMLVMNAERLNESGDDEDEDAAWLAELRALNAAMPYVHKHRARAARRYRE